MASLTPSREPEEQRLVRQRRHRKRVMLFGAVICLLAIPLSLGRLIPGFEGTAFGHGLVVAAVVVFYGVLLGGRFWRWPRMQARLALEVLAKDRRAPIVYLRPFAADRKAGRYEKRIASSLKDLGPIVAVGRPEEDLPATPYIARDYVAADRWQDGVVDLISRAQLVVIQAGASEGLGWELVQVARLMRPGQLLVCLGPRRVPWLGGAGNARSRYRQFREQYGRLFPKGLPAEIRGGVFLTFGPDWTPIPFREVKGPVEDYLSRVLRGLHRRLARFRFA